jgi:hypothetical protein
MALTVLISKDQHSNVLHFHGPVVVQPAHTAQLAIMQKFRNSGQRTEEKKIKNLCSTGIPDSSPGSYRVTVLLE